MGALLPLSVLLYLHPRLPLLPLLLLQLTHSPPRCGWAWLQPMLVLYCVAVVAMVALRLACVTA